MTVAAVVLAASPDSALADAAGTPAVRRIVDTAWSGGATPVVVVAADPDAAVAAALAGSGATLVEPAPAADGPRGQIARGIRAATELVGEATAALVWPARMTWVDPETVTSLIERHGIEPAVVLRPAWRDQAGWPALVPVSAVSDLDALDASLMPDGIIAGLGGTLRVAEVDLGDPGAVIDRATDLAALPPYEGPPEPAAGRRHEWGAAGADLPDDAPLLGGPDARRG